MNNKTYQLFLSITMTVMLICLAIKGYCVFGSGSSKLESICWTIYGVASIILIILTLFRKRLLKQDSEQKDK